MMLHLCGRRAGRQPVPHSFKILHALLKRPLARERLLRQRLRT
jgi:hypothetical protein